MVILALNAGSSSLKFSVLDTSQCLTLVEGRVERISTGAPEGMIQAEGESEKTAFTLTEDSHQAAIREVIKRVNEALKIQGLVVSGIGHRVVHGADSFPSAVRISPDVIAEIHRLSPLAPLHNPANAVVIEAAFQEFPNLPQVAVFDTAFHQTISEEVYRYAVPEDWYKTHKVRRYGFHGTSHSYVSQRAVQAFSLSSTDSKIIVAHLGNGCSATAILGGKSVDTTMGLSPLEGFIMGTRSGNVDPNLHSYIASQTGQSLADITEALNKKSGLLALTGGDSDLRSIKARATAGDLTAQSALEIFYYRLAKEILGLMAALPGSLDALIFTGGIGENEATVRQEVCKRLGCLGILLDKGLNHERFPRERQISLPDSPLVAIIPTNEELEIAHQTEATIA